MQDNYPNHFANASDVTDDTTKSSIKNTDSLSIQNEQEFSEKTSNENSQSLDEPSLKKNKYSAVPRARNVSKNQSDLDIFGLSVASQLKKLSEEQAVIARDEIQSTLTRCRLTDLRASDTSCSITSKHQCQSTKSWTVKKEESMGNISTNNLLELCSTCDDSSGARNNVETVYSDESD